MIDTEELIQRAIDPASVRIEGTLTNPPSFGVYLVIDADTGEERYRFGSPVIAGPGQGLKQALDDFQRGHIAAVLQRHDGNWAACARELEVDRANLHRLARRLGLK